MTQNIAFIFPGQGSQKVGMGHDWAATSEAAQAVFEEADEVLGFSLSGLCWEGPEEDLRLTANTQPAILTCSVAIYRALEEAGMWSASEEAPMPLVMAGHSLGEYSALVVAGALDLATALKLVRRRGELMQDAVPIGQGAMAALMGLEAEAVAEVAKDAEQGAEVCAVANLNSPMQTVIAGDKPAVERAIALAKERGARVAKLLPVSAPFHSPLMRPAREALEPLLAAADFRDLSVPVISNIDASPLARGEAARRALGRQVDGPVRWVESIRCMIDQFEVDTFLEIGFGKVLTALGKRIESGVTWSSMPEPAAAAEFLARLSGSSE